MDHSSADVQAKEMNDMNGVCIDTLLGESSTIKSILEVNKRNSKGLTALDIIDITFQDFYDAKIRAMLTQARVQGSFQHGMMPRPINHESETLPSRDWFQYFKFQKQRDSPSDTRNTLLIVAILIATVSFQAGIQPPNGIFNKPSPSASSPAPSQEPRPMAPPGLVSFIASLLGVFGTYTPSFLFSFVNSLGLTASTCIILYLTSGFPFRRELQISLYSMMFTYGIAVDAIIKQLEKKERTIIYVLVTVAFVLPFVQRWIPRWGIKAWRKWTRREILLPTTN